MFNTTSTFPTRNKKMTIPMATLSKTANSGRTCRTNTRHMAPASPTAMIWTISIGTT
jgi:hypothetical protein